jgi:ArsR family transcriptional regulator, arsenate/arsenite/antimonite-responsive transcriptional repressor
VASRRLEVVEENGVRTGGGEAILRERVEPIVALGRALSDPIRVRMLGMMADAAASGRGCCDLPDLGVPAEDGDAGICVCEFEDRFGMGQSKVSYHMRKLKEAGLVREEKRGRWSFYSLEGEAARELLDGLSEHLGTRAG